MLLCFRFGGWTFGNPSSSKDSDQVATVYYNNKGYHALPSYMNAMNNIILRSSISKGKPSDYGITVYNEPMRLTLNVLDGSTL